MFLKDLIGKKVINKQGKILGSVRENDIVIETNDGRIESIILHNTIPVIISWNNIEKIGSKVIIVDSHIKAS
ncbi:MAG: PRC-barrel domain-containing protein [Halanaerobiales bacterium]